MCSSVCRRDSWLYNCQALEGVMSDNAKMVLVAVSMVLIFVAILFWDKGGV